MRVMLRQIGLLISVGICWAVSSFTAPVSAQHLERIVRNAELVVQAQVRSIDTEIGDYGEPMDVVKLHISDIIVGHTDAPTVVLRLYSHRIVDGPPIPHFKQDEEVILCLKKINGDWAVLGNSLGKFIVTGATIEGSQFQAEQFKSQIKAIVASETASFDFPLGFERNRDVGSTCNAGGPKLGGEFCVLIPERYGPVSGTIEFKINPSGAKDKDGNALSFSDVRSAIERAVITWNNVPHSKVTFSVSNTEFTGNRGHNNNESTITFETHSSNGFARVYPEGGGIIDEVDIVFSSGRKELGQPQKYLRWNTDSSYPSSYSLYDNPYEDGTQQGYYD